MKLNIKKGTTSKRLAIFVQDSSVTTGAGLTGLVFNSAGLAWYYWREDEGNVGGTSVTLVTATRGTFASGGFIEKDATNMPGFYEIGVPDAALATGSNWVTMVLRGATNMAPVTIEIQLVTNDVDAGQTFLADGAHGGTAAVLTLERVVVASTTSNQPAIKATGNGTAAGAQIIGGSTGGHGVRAQGGTGGAGGHGASLEGAGAGHGLNAQGETDGHGMKAVGGSGTTAGFFIQGGGNAGGDALRLSKNGGDKDLKLQNDAFGRSIESMLKGTVDTATFTPTTTQFEADDITEATADHFIGRVIVWTSGALQYQARRIDDYALQNAKGFFTVAAMTEAPANNDTFVIV